MKTDKDIWPFGRYEVYGSEHEEPAEQRLNGFHTREEADEAATAARALGIRDVAVLDRADRFCW